MRSHAFGNRFPRPALFCGLLVLAFALPAAAPRAGEDGGAFIKVDPITYRYRVEAELTREPKRRTVAYLPIPDSDAFQTIENMSHTPGEIIPVPGYPDCKVLKIEQTGEERVIPIFIEYDVTLYAYRADFDKMTEFPPYDTDSELYKTYTANGAPSIDLDNPDLRAVAGKIAAETTTPLEYARQAFMFVKQDIKHTSYNTNWKPQPLADTFKNGGSGLNLQAMFVSLLRANGIPARVVSKRVADGGYRAVSEFHLQGYGWIPADPAYNLGVTQGPDRFFGMFAIPANWRWQPEETYGVKEFSVYPEVELPASETLSLGLSVFTDFRCMNAKITKGKQYTVTRLSPRP